MRFIRVSTDGVRPAPWRSSCSIESNADPEPAKLWRVPWGLTAPFSAGNVYLDGDNVADHTDARRQRLMREEVRDAPVARALYA